MTTWINDPKIPVLYEDPDTERQLPWKWELCDVCEGHGTDRGRSVECDGGGFTASEWAEQDEDFQRDYLNGFYDRPCEACGGGGKIKVADFGRMNEADRKAYEEQQKDFAEIDAIEAMERRMGA